MSPSRSQIRGQIRGGRSRLRKALVAIGLGVVATLAVMSFMGAGSAMLSSCTTTPTAPPVRTFERPQRVDFVCMQVLDLVTGLEITPVPQVQSKCANVPINVDPTTLPYHLYALVTQLGRGEVAVVDLTQGTVIDVDQATPGYNFHVVGKNPTDIAVTPDGLMTFVAAAEVNKPAIYALRNDQVLGDSPGLLGVTPPGAVVSQVTNFPVCALPQAPGALSIVSTKYLANAGTSDAGTGTSDAGATSATDLGYEILAVLPGDDRNSAKLVTIDPRPFFRGAGLVVDKGTTVAPASLVPCPITSAIELAGSAYVASQVNPGPAWDDGIKYVDGGAPAESLPATGTAVCAAGLGSTPDAGLPVNALAGTAARGGSAALAGQILYVADAALPIIHVIDLRSGAAKELEPLVITSVTEPSRVAIASQIAVSPPTRDYKRYLYGIDSTEGTLIVYDVTDPDNGPRAPLTRPHPETNPFQEPDRLSFSSPVATLGFARHEWPLTYDTTSTAAALTGLLCNPNPNAGSAISGDAGGARDPGVFYRSNSAIVIGPPNITNVSGPSPYRLRGIFGFATLTTGAMVAIDVDDWDAPCRRPDPIGTLDGGSVNLPSAITPPEPPPGSANDLDPYHAPQVAELISAGTYSSPVTLEAFFPVSAPNRTRSVQYLRNDPNLGNQLPRIDVLPQLFVNSAIQTSGAANPQVPIMLPTAKGALYDPNEITTAGDPDPNRATTPAQIPNVRFSFESPEVHLDQDWTVTYEGKGPSTTGIAGALSTTDNYQSITITTNQGLFCRRGIEDFRIGQAKAAALASALTAQGLRVPASLNERITDYVQLNEDILDNTDPYWGQADVNGCWDIQVTDPAAGTRTVSLGDATSRYNACAATFGDGEDVNPVMSVQRDFPILEAYQDHLVIGRYGYPGGQSPDPSTRVVVGKDPSNVAFLKLMRCCFHNQVQFNVRTGNEWVAQGSKNGFLHHVTEGAGGQCVLSCNARDALLNSRAPGVTQVAADGKSVIASLLDPTLTRIDRNLPLAMRNPMFSFYIVSGYDASFADVFPQRDSQWRFTSRGQFQPLFINLASQSTAVSPQSMRYVDALGQMAVIDGESQGLMLIDLDVIALAHAPYY